MAKLNPKIRKALLKEARYRCCLHRKTWVPLFRLNNNAQKWETLDIHHVVFRSCGGSDEANNLIPLCPTCHEMLHESRRKGTDFVTDDQLKEHWEHWKNFRKIVPEKKQIGQGDSIAQVNVKLDLYGLDSSFCVDGSVTYTEARQVILENTVGVLGLTDPYFPFATNNVETWEWELSVDSMAAPGREMEQKAADIFRSVKEPIILTAPVIIALANEVHPFFSIKDDHRKL